MTISITSKVPSILLTDDINFDNLIEGINWKSFDDDDTELKYELEVTSNNIFELSQPSFLTDELGLSSDIINDLKLLHK